MRVENAIRGYARKHLPQQLKPYAWLYYTDLKRLVETRRFGSYGAVQVEINTHCNRVCRYCTNFDFPKQEEYMDRRLFEKTVDELAAVGYRGRFCPNLSSEPLLHPDLAELMAYASGQMSKARIVIYTNGDFLDRRKYDELRQAGASQFIVTQHGEAVSEGFRKLLGSLTPEERRMTVFQTLDEVNLFNRGIPGLIPEDRRTRPNPCYVAQNDFTILVDGGVVICGNDFRGEHIFGNVGESSVVEIWNNPEYREARRQVRRGRFELDLCKRCVY
jgi:8-amino-3,8-dideoxy-alpha-D-manno-octulosonate transaminase